MHLQILFILFMLCAGTGFLNADPWGKDADISFRAKCPPITVRPHHIPPTPILNQFAEAAIAFHQNVISPADGPRSHFIPSSSQYALEAIKKYGFFQGFVMGCDRLMRENSDPWVYSTVQNDAGQTLKWNPVP